ncbi:MAG TPA: hypothetical protein VGL89_07680 [Candidatus Koribacter sp.]|jgi:hypothetical protein
MKFQECQHVFASGNTCRSPRLRNQRFCYYHVAVRDRLRRQRLAAERKLPLQLPVLEDESTIQLALGDVVNAMLADRIDAKKAALTLYALQTASANLKHAKPSAPATYTEYAPDLDAALPPVDAAPDQASVAAEEPASGPKKIPRKKPVTGADGQRPNIDSFSRFMFQVRKKELKAIRKYTKAFSAGAASPLPWTIKADQEEIAKHEERCAEVAANLKKASASVRR